MIKVLQLNTIIKAKPIDILNSTIEKHINKIPKIEKYNIGDHVRITGAQELFSQNF